MKEIGEKLKEAREEMGVSIEEAADDLKIRPSQVQNIEDGNMDAFKDIFALKYFIRDYAKYLGLSYEDMVDDFNEYLFDYTSKISLEDIKNAKNKEPKKKSEQNRVASPYTLVKEKKFPVVPFLVISILVLVITVVAVLTINIPKKDNTEDNNVIAMNI